MIAFQETEGLEIMLSQQRLLLQRPDFVDKTNKNAIYVAGSFCRLDQQQKEEFEKCLNFPRAGVSLHSSFCKLTPALGKSSFLPVCISKAYKQEEIRRGFTI